MMVYVDKFGGGNSNYYWLESFEKITEVSSFNIRKYSSKYIFEKILEIKPNHIHFGGSVKRERFFPVEYVKKIRERFKNVKITFFYGDAYYFPYQRNIIPYIDKLFISHIPSDICSDKVIFQPCPTNLKKSNLKFDKIYEVSFIGNNYSKNRLKDLKKISEVCNLTVFGNGWEKTGLKYEERISFEEFPKVVEKSMFCLGNTLYMFCEWSGARICEYYKKPLSDILCHDERCVNYKSLNCYFSNRVMNLCGCGGSILLFYSEGLDKIFTDRKNIIFFKNLEDLRKKIDYYKNNLQLLENIGSEAYELSRKYIFDVVAKKILS